MFGGWKPTHCVSSSPLSSHLCRVIVGAPKATSTYSSSVHSPGAVYKCRVHSNPERRCTEMDLGRGQSPHSAAAAAAAASRQHLMTRTTCTSAPTHNFNNSSEINTYHTERFTTHAHTCLVFPPASPVHSVHTLPQASVLFYQNNAALCCF